MPAAAGQDPGGASPTPAPPPSAPGPCDTAMKPSSAPLTITSSGISRDALVHVPAGIPAGRRAPLVFALGGAGQNGSAFEAFSGLSRLADRHRFLIVYPTATGSSPFWNISGQIPGKPDDVRFINDLLDTLERTLCVDVNRVYATGVSNGGGMTARLGCEMSARLAAIVPVAGGYATLPPCRPDRPVSVLEIHGTADRVVPYEGKGPAHSGRISDYMHDWAERDGCAAPKRHYIGTQAVRVEWWPCSRGTEVAHLRLIGGAHAWPGSSPTGPGQRSKMSAAQSAYDFFRAHVRARRNAGR